MPGGDAELEVDGRTTTLVLDVKRAELARRNIATAEVNRAVAAALGGETVGTMVEGNRRCDIVVRLPDNQRADETVIAHCPSASARAACCRSAKSWISAGKKWWNPSATNWRSGTSA